MVNALSHSTQTAPRATPPVGLLAGQFQPPGQRTAVASVATDPFGMDAWRCERLNHTHHSPYLATVFDFARAAVGNRKVSSMELTDVRAFSCVMITAHVVANHYCVTPDEVFARSRLSAPIASVRMVIMHIAAQLGGFPIRDVSKIFGRDHSTVCHAKSTIEAMRMDHEDFDEAVERLENMVLDLWAIAGDGDGMNARFAQYI